MENGNNRETWYENLELHCNETIHCYMRFREMVRGLLMLDVKTTFTRHENFDFRHLTPRVLTAHAFTAWQKRSLQRCASANQRCYASCRFMISRANPMFALLSSTTCYLIFIRQSSAQIFILR